MFGQMFVTSKGALLSAKTLQGKTLQFDHIEIGSGELDGSEIDKEALTQKELECSILTRTIINNNQVRFSFFFKNTDAENSFYFREIGLIAIDPDTGEQVLYAYANAGINPEYINNSKTISNSKTIDIDVLVDNATDVTIEIVEPTPYATKEELEDVQNELENIEETIIEKIEKSIIVVSEDEPENSCIWYKILNEKEHQESVYLETTELDGTEVYISEIDGTSEKVLNMNDGDDDSSVVVDN